VLLIKLRLLCRPRPLVRALLVPAVASPVAPPRALLLLSQIVFRAAPNIALLVARRPRVGVAHALRLRPSK
jgi:hypothetical protein